MNKRISSRASLAAACAAALGGVAALSAFTFDGAPAPAKMAAADFDPAFYLCHTPMVTGGTLMQLAQLQTEVPAASMKAATPSLGFADTDPPLWDGLGTIAYKITTASAEAQKYFDQGLRLAFAFNHLEAQRAFRKAEKLDPSCAMCFWGEALVLGPNINLPMQEDAIAPAYAAAQKARALVARASPREQALIEAVALRYGADAKTDRAALDKDYANAMAGVAKQFPDDNEILTLYAEAVMDLSPWDYWEAGGAIPHLQSAPIVPTLERVLARAPNHPGAIHYYIHAVEASDRAERAEPYADRLRGKIPNAGHLVHMPGHIYYRVGRYFDALAVNKDAVAVDEKYLTATNAPMGVYRLGYYPHNVHFAMASAQMSGDGPTVIAAAQKLDGLIPSEAARGIAMVQPVKAAPYFAHAQFSTPEAILALPDPGPAIAYVQAMWRYARGVAQVQKRDFTAAENEAKAIETLEGGDFAMLKAAGVPAQSVLQLARTVIRGRIAQAQGDYKTAVVRFEEAAKLQDALPYTEPPYWYYPMRQSLGAALVQAGRFDEAEDQFLLALRRAPNNGWSYFGLSELYKAQGKADDVRRAEGELAKTWIGDKRLLQLSRL